MKFSKSNLWNFQFSISWEFSESFSKFFLSFSSTTMEISTNLQRIFNNLLAIFLQFSLLSQFAFTKKQKNHADKNIINDTKWWIVSASLSLQIAFRSPSFTLPPSKLSSFHSWHDWSLWVALYDMIVQKRNCIPWSMDTLKQKKIHKTFPLHNWRC